MAKLEVVAMSPARLRVGLPVIPDGSPRLPLLLRLPPAADGSKGSCNNGCAECLTAPVDAAESAWDVEVGGRHVVIRDREPTLRRDLPQLVSALKSRGPASIAILTNGRLLGYRKITGELLKAGAERFIVKLFGHSPAEHDAHTREPGSFEQALRGIDLVRALGGRAFVTFPLEAKAEGREPELTRRRTFARDLTGHDLVEMPEPQVESHAGEFRYDLIRRRGDLTRTYFGEAFFPMVHVNTGPVCNIRCLYCNVHGGDDQRLYPVDYIESLIDEAGRHVQEIDARGHPTMDFIGGEPTLHPDLPRLIARARKAGFKQVTICTNGVLLLKKGYLDSLVAAGLTGVRFSFHDHRPEMANRLADVPGLGNRYVDVAEMLLARTDLQTHLFRILLAETIDALPDYMRWLAEHNRSGRPIDLTIGMPSMRGRLFDHQALYPRLEQLRPAVQSAVELGKQLGFELTLHHTPGCLFPEEHERHACLHIMTTQVEPLVGRTNLMNFEGDARFAKACEGCAGHSGGCHGLPAHYWEADPAACESWVRPHDYVPEKGTVEPSRAVKMGA